MGPFEATSGSASALNCMRTCILTWRPSPFTLVHCSPQALEPLSLQQLTWHDDTCLRAGAYRRQGSGVHLRLRLALCHIRIASAAARCPGGSAQSQCAHDETCWKRSATSITGMLDDWLQVVHKQAAALMSQCACRTCNRGHVLEGRAHTYMHVCLARPDLPDICRAGQLHDTPRRTWALHYILCQQRLTLDLCP